MTAPVIAALSRSRIVPVVTIRHLCHIDPIAAGLADGGVECVEITLRTAHGLEAIRRTASRGDLRVGAGTVLDEDAAQAAVESGASFVVSPGLDEVVIEETRRRDIVALPGVATATELQRARRLGLRHVKVFPAAQLGGLGVVEALHQPFPDMAFLPSGGVTADTAASFLAHPAVFAVGSSWLVPTARGDDLYEQVRARTRETLRALGDAADHGPGDG